MMPNYDYSKDLTSDNKNGLVYVIDDDADVRESIKWLLESTNYRVEAVSYTHLTLPTT